MTTCIDYYNNNTTFKPILNFLSYIVCNFNNHDDSIYLNYNYEKYNNLNNYNEKLEIIENNYPNIYYFFFTSSLIILSDTILIILFGYRARWFQLHSLINLLISIYIFKDYIKILIDPSNGYKTLNNNYVSYLILNYIYFIYLHLKI